MLNPKSKSQGMYNWIFFLIIFLLTILVAIVWYIFNAQKQPQVLQNQSLPSQSEATTVNNTANWKTYRSDKFGFEFKYPNTWQDQERDIEIKNYFIVNPQIEVFNISLIEGSINSSLLEIAQNKVAVNNCPPSDGQAGDHMIRSDESGTLYVLYCSATSEDYIYLFKNKKGDVIELDYHDNFEENWSEDKKLTVFNKIISTITLIP